MSALEKAPAELPEVPANTEDYERAMDLQWRHADIIARTDLYDSEPSGAV
jgi:hypothetical protein